MRGGKAKLTFFLGFQCRRLHKNHQFFCPMKNRQFLKKVGFWGNVGFTGFLLTIFGGHDKTVSVVTQNLQSNYNDLFKNPLILCGTSLRAWSTKR